PDGQVASYQGSIADDGSNGTIQLYRRNPTAGRWILSLNVRNPVSGSVVSAPFTVHVAYDGAQVQATGLPRGQRLAAGQPVTVPVQVTNTSNRRLSFFADPRLTAAGDVVLPPLQGDTFPLPMPPDATPAWIVPPETTNLTVS